MLGELREAGFQSPPLVQYTICTTVLGGSVKVECEPSESKNWVLFNLKSQPVLNQCL